MQEDGFPCLMIAGVCESEDEGLCEYECGGDDLHICVSERFLRERLLVSVRVL